MVAGLLGAGAGYLGIKTKRDLAAYAGMIHDRFHPVWRDLAFRRIGKGDRLEDLVARHTPLRRDDFAPFVLLHYQEPFGSLTVVARDGRLVEAVAGSCTWQHVFFETPEMKEELAKAHSAYLRQRLVEIDMYRIHRAAASGQSVFLARVIGSLPLSSDMWAREDAMLKLPSIEVEVIKVVCGAIARGTKLQIPTTEIGRNDLSELETVFLHVEDSRILYPHASGGELYTTASRGALDRYLTLSPEQIHAVEARCLAQSPDLAKCLRFTRNEARGQPVSASDSSPRATGLGIPEE